MLGALHLIPAGAAIVFNANVWDATIQAFANFAAIVTIASGVTAWVALQDGESAAGIADAAGLGLALGFLPGLAVAAYVYIYVAQTGIQ